MLRFLWTQKEDIGPLGLEVMTPEIWRAEDIDPAFEALKGHAEALYVILEPLVSTYRVRINTLALGPEAGGLISYGSNFPDQFRRSYERESAWPQDRGVVPAPRRRGDRMKRREFITLLGGASACSSIWLLTGGNHPIPPRTNRGSQPDLLGREHVG